MATLLKVLNNLADIKSAGGLHMVSELRGSLSAAVRAFVDGMSIGDLDVEPSENKAPDLPTASGRVYANGGASASIIAGLSRFVGGIFR